MENPSEITNTENHITNDLEEAVENVGGMIDLNTSTNSIEALDEIVGTLDSNMAKEMAHVEETHNTVEISSEVPTEVDDFLQKRRSTIVTKQFNGGDDSLDEAPQADAAVEEIALPEEPLMEEPAEEVALQPEPHTEITVEEVVLQPEPKTEIMVEEATLQPEPHTEFTVEDVAITNTNDDIPISDEPSNQIGSTMEQSSNNIGIEALNGLVSDLDNQANQIYSTLDQISKQMVTIGENMQNMGKRIENIGKEVSSK